jgi:hypothetical protein
MATETIGTGGDYANELQWVAGIPASLAANEIGVGLTGEHSNSSTDIYISGITLNGFTLQLTAQAGNSFIDNINPISDRIFYDPTMGAACLLTGNCYRFTTEVPMTINKYLFHKESDFESLFYLPSGSASTLIDQIIGKISNGGTLAGTFRAAPSGEIVLRRSILYSTNNIDSINYAGINISAENCLFINLAAVVFVDGPSSEVDVNIHPRKNEIQFKNPDFITALLVRAVRDILKLEHYNASIETNYQPEPPEALNESVAPTSVVSQSSLSLQSREREIRSSVSGEVKSTDHLRVSFSPTSRFEYLGEIDCTYLVTKLGTKLILFDQHALHERIIYERLLLHYRDKSRIESQRLLFPVSVTVADAEYLIENDELLQTLGFELRLWNDQKIQIVAAPSVLKRNYQAVLEKLIESKDLPVETALRDTLATLACHSAVRAHDRLQPEEILLLKVPLSLM